MQIVEIQIEDIPEAGVVEVYLMGEHHVCSDQEPFHYHDRASRSEARRKAKDRGYGLSLEHNCRVSWNF